MVKVNPELGRAMPSSEVSTPGAGTRPSSLYSNHRPGASVGGNRRSFAGSPIAEPTQDDGFGDDGIPAGASFTYIPPHPKKYYKRLLEICITADLEAMLSDAVDDDDEVSLGILTLPHLELLNECAVRWRIGQPYRAACFLDIVRQFYERNDVPLECIPEALQSVDKVKADYDLNKWPVSDVSMWKYYAAHPSTDHYCSPISWLVCMASSSLYSYQRCTTPWTPYPT